ncbi:MAG: DNA polymerase III subunit gamma/tau [Bacteroidota bacterium]
MESFVVSARKFRPGAFESVIGQDAITRTLRNAIKQNQLAQAFLFCGPRGVGKTTCARILAKTINCQNITDTIEPCNNCESCLNFNTSASFNIYELDAASNNSVDDIRSLIDQVRIPPQTGKYKVYIIDEVHMLSTQAFNAFLKTLEEPPAYAKFILATTEKQKVIPTILSRCQIFDFKRISIDDIILQLKLVATSQEIQIEEDALHIIAQKADGSMRDALSIFDQMANFSGNVISYQKVIENLNVLDYDYFFRATEHFIKNDIPSSLLLFSDVIESGFEGQHFLGGLAGHLRNLLVCQNPETIRLLDVGDSLKNRYLNQAKTCQANFLLQSMDRCNQYDLSYKNANNKRLHIEILLTQLCAINLNSISGNATQVERKTHNTVSISPSVPIPIKKETPSKEVTPAEPEIAPITPEPIPTETDTAVAQGFVLKQKPQLPNYGKGSLSLKGIASEIEKKNLEDEEGKIPDDAPADKFEEARLQEIWMKFAETFQQKASSLYTTLMKRKPLKKSDFIIGFEVDNKLQENDLNDKKKDILPYFRKELNNYFIDIEFSITAISKDNRPYTAIDKFKRMAAVNPAILTLKDQLDLELEL